MGLRPHDRAAETGGIRAQKSRFLTVCKLSGLNRLAGLPTLSRLAERDGSIVALFRLKRKLPLIENLTQFRALFGVFHLADQVPSDV